MIPEENPDTYFNVLEARKDGGMHIYANPELESTSTSDHDDILLGT